MSFKDAFKNVKNSMKNKKKGKGDKSSCAGKGKKGC